MAERSYDDRPATGALEPLRMLLNSDDRFRGIDHFDADDGPRAFLERHGVLRQVARAGKQVLRRVADASGLEEAGQSTSTPNCSPAFLRVNRASASAYSASISSTP